MATVSNKIISIQPLSAPSGLFHFIDFNYEQKMEKKSRRRKSMMKRFKIKYTNTKGVVKTRNIKATSEEKAMSEIKDMSQHHYTIVESIEEEKDDPDPAYVLDGIVPIKGRKLDDDKKAVLKWIPIVESLGSGLSEEKKSWLSQYIAKHAEWESTTQGVPYMGIDPAAYTWNGSGIPAGRIASFYGSPSSIELPNARRIFSKTMPQSAFDDAPSNEEKKN